MKTTTLNANLTAHLDNTVEESSTFVLKRLDYEGNEHVVYITAEELKTLLSVANNS